MAASNHRPRISLQFNDFDFRHRKVLEILRARPRNMTDMVVNAILHFISCPDAEQEYNKESMKKAALAFVRRPLSRMNLRPIRISVI